MQSFQDHNLNVVVSVCPQMVHLAANSSVEYNILTRLKLEVAPFPLLQNGQHFCKYLHLSTVQSVKLALHFQGWLILLVRTVVLAL